MGLIEPIIAERVCAAATGRQPAISGSARVRRNVAEHVFDQKINISLESDVAPKRAQRGKPHGAMEVFELLRGMAMEPPSIVNAGGQVPVEDAPVYIEWEGVSLSDLSLARRADNEAVIEKVKEGADLSWQLVYGDIVYEGGSRWPHRVVRIGWGQYEKEVRIVRLPEDAGKWESGKWCNTSRLFKLEAGDVLEVIEAVEDASEDRRMIPRGAQCRFLRLDPDGDPELSYGDRIFCIFMHDLDTLSMR